MSQTERIVRFLANRFGWHRVYRKGSGDDGAHVRCICGAKADYGGVPRWELANRWIVNHVSSPDLSGGNPRRYIGGLSQAECGYDPLEGK
jgi:hypothetical protein